MKILTLGATLLCEHKPGMVALKAAQTHVTIAQIPILVHGDPVGKTIGGCPFTGVGIVPCTQTTSVTQGYSSLVHVDGAPVCLDTIQGLTNSVPPVTYSVMQPGQQLVTEAT